MNGQFERSMNQEMDWEKIVASTTPASPMAWLTVAHLRLSSGDVLGADKALENVIVLNKEKKEIDLANLGGFFFNLALAAGKQGRWDLVLKSIGSARELGFLQTASSDQKQTLAFEMAKAQAVHFQYKEAIESLKYILYAEPNHVGALTLLGHIYFQTGDLSIARETYVRALRLGADDPNIAHILDKIEYALPVEWEKDLPKNVDPYIRAALEFVLDHWLALSIEKLTPENSKKFNQDLLAQFTLQVPAIMNGKTDSVILKVPVPRLLEEMSDSLRITIAKDDANRVHKRYINAVRIVLEKILKSDENKSESFIQERTCTLGKDQITQIKQGAPITELSFVPLGAPLFLTRLHIKFAREVIEITNMKESNKED